MTTTATYKSDLDRAAAWARKLDILAPLIATVRRNTTSLGALVAVAEGERRRKTRHVCCPACGQRVGRCEVKRP